MKKPEKMPTPSEVAVEKLAELEFEFPEAGVPEDVDMPELPEMPMKPTGPTLPELTLPEQAMDALVDVEIPAAELPSEIFDIV